MSLKSQHKKTELLAPAGSLEAFFAAMEKGADAVYAGLKEFSARAKAKNFTLHDMERMTAYAHSMQRRVYVTINTLVKEDELPRLIDTLSALEAMGCDGVIIQDLAVARLVRRHFPSIPLHASTQMTIHNSAGVKQLAELGFQRVVLARELHIDEIRDIGGKSPIEIECFIHGALCFSISGQCYFSSFLGGHSGNRGRCAQPCRRQYSYRGKDGYWFSTNDFSSIDMLPQLKEAGVASLKIEGRMKSAEYVASVVGAYRLALDAPSERQASAVAEAKELLKLSFGRVPTKGFLASHAPTDIATPTLKGATGRFLGEIQNVQGERFTFESRDRLHVGDRVRVQPKSDMAGRGFTIKELFVGRQQVKNSRERSVVTLVAPFAVKRGDAVFKVSSETAFTMSESACRKRLEGFKGGKLPCDLNIALHDGTMRISATVAGRDYLEEFPLGPLEPSRTSDMAGVLATQFAKCGDTPFQMRTVAADDFPMVMIPPARLKEIRRLFYQGLAEEVLPVLRENRRRNRDTALSELPGKRQIHTLRDPELTIRVEQLRDLNMLQIEGIGAISLPISRANMHQLPHFSRKLQGRGDRIWWRLPFIIWEEDLTWYRGAVEAIVNSGCRRFEAANLSHFQLLAGLDCEISTDYRLFSLNSQALLSWQELGAKASTLYIEDDAENLMGLLSADIAMELRVMLYGSVPAITSKIAIKGVKSDAPVVSDRGDAYEVTTRDGLTIVTPTRRFSLIGFRSRLQEMGCRRFIIDLSAAPRDDWQRILDAFNRGVPVQGTSSFNFETGLV
jgi:putative protease